MTRGRATPAPAPASGSLAEEQRRLMRAKARRAEIEVRKMSGELVSVAEVESHAFNRARQLRDHLLSVPGRLAPVLANQDARECHRLLESEMNAIADDMADLKFGGKPA